MVDHLIISQEVYSYLEHSPERFKEDPIDKGRYQLRQEDWTLER